MTTKKLKPDYFFIVFGIALFTLFFFAFTSCASIKDHQTGKTPFAPKEKKYKAKKHKKQANFIVRFQHSIMKGR
jgi:hypothetical protein